jgi:hypothetical protein
MRLLALVVLTGIGCAGDPDSGSGEPASMPDASEADAHVLECDDSAIDPSSASFPCAVETVIAAKCRRCHDVKAVTDVCRAAGECLATPFPLLTWADTRQDLGSKQVLERMITAVSVGFMPLQDPDLMPPVEALTAAEKETLLDWLMSCAPPADDASPPCP